jgi:hypothetical protein
MGALVELFLDRGSRAGVAVLPRAAIERMEQPRSTLGARQGLNYGYGLGLRQYIRGAFRWYGHGGDADGYLSHFAYSRDAEAGYFLGINAFNHSALDAMKRRVERHLTQGLSPPPKPPEASVDPDALRTLAGRYEAITRRFPWEAAPGSRRDRLEVVLEAGALHIRSPSGLRRLTAVTPRLFRRDSEPVATIAFAKHEGRLHLQGDFGSFLRVGPGARTAGSSRPTPPEAARATQRSVAE